MVNICIQSNKVIMNEDYIYIYILNRYGIENLLLLKYKKIKNIFLLKRFYIKKDKFIYYNFYIKLINIIFTYFINI